MPRSACSTRSARPVSAPDTDSMSTRAAVSVAASVLRSSMLLSLGRARSGALTTVCAVEATAWAYGLATVTTDGRTLDAWYPAPALGPVPGGAKPDHDLTALAGTHGTAHARGVTAEVVLCELDLAAPPETTVDAYLRLHLLSHRLVAPRGLNLDGVFAVLPNVVWTNFGPCAVEDFERVRAALRRHGNVQVFGVD